MALLSHQKKGFWALLVALCVILSASPSQSASDTDKDFLYLDIQRSLREEPASALRPARLFGAAEYVFDMKNYREAERLFREASSGKAPSLEALLAKVYLAEIARVARGEEKPVELAQLKESLSKKHFVSAFGKTERRNWSSPLKNEYELVEHVDSLEVYKNGALFYVVRLP